VDLGRKLAYALLALMIFTFSRAFFVLDRTTTEE